MNNGNVTLKDVAVALGVSTMTVSRAINDKANVSANTKKRVIETAKKMGYSPNLVAKSLVSSKTYTIGVVIPKISHSFFPEVVSGIEEASNRENYQIFLTNTSDDFEKEKKVIDALRAKRVDGILVSSSQNKEDFSYYEKIIESGLPLVFFDRCIENIGASCIGVNDFAASQQITEHLIKKGFKQIGYLSGPKKVSIGKERFGGYIAAMNKYGLDIDDKWVVEKGYNEDDGYQAMKKLLALSEDVRPNAIVAVNDPVAFGAMDAIRDAGLKVPEDFAIVGFTNDIRAELVSCPLTTIHQPAYEVGKKAASKLIKTIEDESEPIEHVQLITKLIVRKSCGS